MPLTESAAIIIAAIITAVLSTATSIGISVGSTEYQKNLIRKAEQNKATYGDVLEVIDKLTIASKSKSAAQQNALQNRLNQIFTNNSFTSGLSETVLGRIRNKVSQIKAQVENYVTLGRSEQEQAELQASALSGMSAEERAKAKKADGSWDLDTAAGRSGAAAEEHSNKAADYYKQATELGEKYV